MALEAAIERIDGTTAVVTVTGPLTLGTNLKTLDLRLQQMVEDGMTKLVMDLAGCPYADSAGLGLLMHTYGLLNERGGAIRLSGVSDRVGKLLTMTKADGVLPSDADRAASLLALQ